MKAYRKKMMVFSDLSLVSIKGRQPSIIRLSFWYISLRIGTPSFNIIGTLKREKCIMNCVLHHISECFQCKIIVGSFVRTIGMGLGL